MKTNVIMTRKMGDFEVKQRTKDCMFNATDLLKQWNRASGQKKVIGHFFENHATEEFIDEILSNEDFKHRNSVYLKTRGKYGGTWMHPYLFIDFAMWINPKFKLKVIQFVHDQLIALRHSAGDNYNVLSAAVSRLRDKDYREVAIAIQWLVFNKRGKDLRQTATSEQLKEISEIEHQLAFSIEMGYINSQEQLMAALRKMYHKKYPSATTLLTTV